MARHPNTSAGRGLGERSKGNYGQEHKGSKSPFRGESPMETAAPGEHFKNVPRGPSLRGDSSLAVQPGVDKASRRDVRLHTGRD